MKKSVLAVALAFGVSGVFAQDLTSKKGEKYLPEAKDWSIGFDALPILNAVGHAVSAQTGGTGTTGSINQSMGTNIMIKMFKDEKTAYRGVIGINFGSTTEKELVDQDPYTGAPPTPQVEDTKKSSTNSIVLGGGLEMRRGTTRLQGYYGGMLMFNLGGSKNTYTYGNALSANNTSNPSTFAQQPGRTSEKQGSTFGLKVNGFIGAEYFVLPKLSLGAEYWWGIGFSSTGEGEDVTESWNGTAVTTTTSKSAGGSSFNIGGSYASLFVNLHF